MFAADYRIEILMTTKMPLNIYIQMYVFVCVVDEKSFMSKEPIPKLNTNILVITIGKSIRSIAKKKKIRIPNL